MTPEGSVPASPEPADAAATPTEDALIEPEPLLSYAAFGSDVPSILARDAATCLRVSDKLLAMGTRSGAVHLLDYEGNKVQTFREHTASVTDLSFDADAETLASASADGHLALCSLYSGAASRLRCRGPATAVALDPRHAHRKTKDVYYGTAAGALLLSSRGWLGAAETVLFQGRGAVKAARASGTMLAWVTDSGLRVYDTSDHSRVGKVGRPGSARPGSAGGGGDAGGGSSIGSSCSLEWVGDRELLMGWGRHVVAVAVVPIAVSAGSSESGSAAAATPPPPTPPTPSGSAAAAATTSHRYTLQVVAEFEVRGEESSGGSDGSGTPAAAAPESANSEPSGSSPTPSSPTPNNIKSIAVLGVAPFGRDLAVLTRISGSSSTASRIQLRVYDRVGTLLSSDDVDLGEAGSTEKSAGRVTMAAFYSLRDVVVQRGGKQELSTSLPTHYAASMSSYLAPDLLLNRGRAFLGLSTQGEEPTAVAVPVAISAAPATPPRASCPPPAAPRRFQWWSDGAEPLYFIVSAGAVAVGRPRSAADRIAWLAARFRFDEALLIAETDPSVKPPARLKLGERYLRHLCDARQYDAAAALCPRILGADAPAWERWVYTFGQAAQLPALAPHLPTGPPHAGSTVLLSPAAYDLTLAACLRGPAGHEALRELVEALPTGSYDAAALLGLVGQRLRPATAGGTAQAPPPPALRRVASSLHGQLGQHEAALGLLLGLRSSVAFDYVREQGLYGAAARAAGDLIELDEVRATALLVEAAEEAPPHAVVASIQARIDAATENNTTTATAAAPSGEPDERSRWSLRLYHYLDWLWQRDAGAAAPFAALHVDLCAAHDPSRLLALLSSSSVYPLDAALEACESRGLVRESVYVLGRMGSADAALRLIVGRLRDVAGAVAFVRESRDDELWELLISLTLGDAALAGELLDHAGAGGADPRRLVAAIPDALAIERLRDRLVAVVADFRAALALQAGCNAVLRGDCTELGDRLYARLRRALGRLHLLRPGGRWEVHQALVGRPINGEAEDGGTVEGEAAVGAAATAQAAEAAWAVGQGRPRVWVGTVGSPPRRMALTPPASVRSSPSKFPPGRRSGTRTAA